MQESLTREINKILDDTGIPSISIALLKDDRIIWSDAFGYSNLRMKVPATPETVYSTGSCFKPVTAMAVMQLVDAGKLNLDDPINKYRGKHSVHDRTVDGKPVTVRPLRPRFCGRKRAVAHGFVPVDLFEAIEFVEQPWPGLLEHAPFGSVAMATPARCRRRRPLW